MMILIGDGRLARHLTRYFEQLSLPFLPWSRRALAEGRTVPLERLVEQAAAERGQPTALLAIKDAAVEPFIAENLCLERCDRVHFAGRLTTPLAWGAHPLFSFSSSLHERELYERIPFVIDQAAPPLSRLIPGLPNPEFRLDPERRARYHALCVLAGNFTTLLWRKLFFELDWELDMKREHALPYLESVLQGLVSPGAPLTGPLARGDRATVEENLKALGGDPFEGVYQAFVRAFEGENERSGKEWLASP
ncbi:MAG TPA: DUF2520 domain-containing protein [Bdellovibrionota bacterium]|nr:DUF2520 domain-containing protein [Bdellovibrionota bacterium]